MATEAMATISFLLFLCSIATPGKSAILTTKPSSVNISVDAVAEFVCAAQENRVSTITWANASSITSPFLESNASLGITIETTGDETSSRRRSTLRIEGRQEYNGTRVKCTANGFSTAVNVTSATSEEATLLIQGRLDPVPGLMFTEVDDCCKWITWNMPYSLAGVPILGYNVTSPNLNVGKFVTGSTRTVVCSNQLQQNNAIVSVQGYIGVDGGISSIALDFSIDTQPEIQVGREQLTRGGVNWTLPITIVDLVCSGLSQDLDKLAVTIADELNGLVLVQTEVVVNGTTAANVPVPDNTKFSLQGNFSLTFRNGLSLSSTFSFERTISTFDFRNISIDYDPGNKTCLRCEAIANSRAAACLLLVNSMENETDQRALAITPTSANVYRTCVDVVPGVYNLTAYDISSDVGPLTVTPAVILTGVLVSPTVPTTTTDQMPTDDTSSTANAMNILVITGSVTLSVVFLVILIPIVMVIIIKKGCLSKEAPSDEQGKKLEEKQEEESAPKEGVQKETGQEETGHEEPGQDHLQTSSVQSGPNMPKDGNYTEVVPLAAARKHHPYEAQSIVYCEVQKQPAINPRVSHEQVMEFVAANVMTKWFEMGRALHLPMSILEDIEERNMEHPTFCISDVFSEWENQRSRPYTWEAIITALRSNDVEEDDLAQDLESQLKVHQPCTRQGELAMYEQLNHSKKKSASFTRPTSYTKYSKLDTRGPNPELAVIEAVQKLDPSMWHRLGLRLAITPPELENIRVKNNDDQQKCLQDVVNTWREKQMRPFDLELLNQVLSSFGDYHQLVRSWS